MVNGGALPPGKTIFAVTGHRPDKLGGYDNVTWARICWLAIKTMKMYDPSLVITGMALGWDMAVASACVTLQIPFVAAVPFAGQERKWPHETQRLYRLLCTQAAEFRVLYGGGYDPWKMQRRNEWMVDRCEEVIALWNGVNEGGTFRCVDYAERKGVKVNNMWDAWSRS